MFNKKILSLSVITSSACNLNCSFCYLHKNNSYKEFHKLLTKAWEDGTYIKNLDKVFTKLEANKNDIQEIHFWGGETLIQVDTIAKNVPAIYKVFPNLQEWHMSTNWVINIQSYFNFLLEVDKYACPQTEIIVQISIDGPPGKCSENGHDGWGVYRKNFTDFLNLVNQHKFKNISIRFHFKSTLSKELYLSEFSTYDGIKNYMKYMTDFIKEIDSQCINRAVNVREDFTLPSIARPNIYSKEEGQKLRDILLMWEEVNLREFKEGTIPFMFGLNEFNGDKIIFDSNDQCGEFLDRLTINYDGTIVECSGVFIDYYKPYQEELLQEGKKIYMSRH